MTCRCNMCGGKNAGGTPRNSYWRNGIRHDEGGIYTARQKIAERRIRRAREKAALLRSL